MDFLRTCLFLLLLVVSTSWGFRERWLLDSARMEFSYGNSQLFIQDSERIDLNKKEKSVLPTSAALLMGEWFATQKWHALGVFHLPLGTQKFLVDSGVVVEERVSPFLGLGPLWVPQEWNFRSYAKASWQISLIGGVAFRPRWEVVAAPVLGSRFHIAARDGFTMYLGGSWTVGIRAFSLVYGVGHRF